MELTSTNSWRMTLPEQAADWLCGLRKPWWIAGGWALDLFVGHQTRPHADLDVGILRRDVPIVLRHLASWECYEATQGNLVRMAAGAIPRVEVNSLWCRPAGSVAWTLEILLDHSDNDRWLFRRQPQISRPLTTLTRRGASGIPYLAPEIQLLYKSKSPRPRDQTDFDCVAPLLDSDGRTWLRDSLRSCDPQHEWLRNLN